MIKNIKPFAKSKEDRISNLHCAYISNEYVIATNGHMAIRLKHTEQVEQPYLYDFITKAERHDVNAYRLLNFDSIINNKTQFTFLIHVDEWLQAHELALIAAKGLNNKNVFLNSNVLEVKNEKDGISFRYELEASIDENIRLSYNAKYMLDILKTFKKLKVKQVRAYHFGFPKPLYLVSKEVEMLLATLRR